MIELSPHADGFILRVRAAPGARASGVGGERGGALKVSVTQSPERGKANRAIQEVLCEALRLRKSQIELIAGATSRDKQFLIRGIASEQLTERLRDCFRSA
jgi:uncharacterized protein YggU (UPF0235/DUF167 family)